MTFSLAQQIEECAREIRLREDVYPRMVRARKMREGVAEHHLARMKAILVTLEWLQERRDLIVQRLGDDA